MWFVIITMGMSIRCGDMIGVTSIVRVLGLLPECYPCILNCYHSASFDLNVLIRLWVQWVLKMFSTKVMVNGRAILLGDGIKIGKEGKKMPGVKLLHQDSESNSKAEFIMGHSIQVVALLVAAGASFFAVPLNAKIHEGLKYTNRDKKTLLDKFYDMLMSLGLDVPCYVLLDKYYGSGKLANKLCDADHHLITMVKTTAVGYEEVENKEKKVGRPKKYGNKITLKKQFKKEADDFIAASSPIQGDQDVEIKYMSKDLLWKASGRVVRYIWVMHPTKGNAIILSTDTTLEPLQIIELYGYRFKIEVSFKQAVHSIGMFSYRFWLASMKRTKRGDGDKYLHKESKRYREKIKKKLLVYEKYIHIGIIAQGLLQYLSTMSHKAVWSCFGSWLRTIRPGIPPSEKVTSVALSNSLPEFLLDRNNNDECKKFLLERIDFSRSEGIKFAA